MCVFVCSRLVVVWVVFGVFEFYEVGGVVLYEKNYHSRFTDFFNSTVIPTYPVFAFGLNGTLSLYSMLLL